MPKERPRLPSQGSPCRVRPRDGCAEALLTPSLSAEAVRREARVQSLPTASARLLPGFGTGPGVGRWHPVPRKGKEAQMKRLPGRLWSIQCLGFLQALEHPDGFPMEFAINLCERQGGCTCSHCCDQLVLIAFTLRMGGTMH